MRSKVCVELCLQLTSREFKAKTFLKGCTSTGSEPFSLFICLDANKFVLLSFFSLIKTINPRVSNKPLPSDAKSPLPVDVHGSKKLLLKHFDAFRPSVHTNTLSVFIENALI